MVRSSWEEWQLLAHQSRIPRTMNKHKPSFRKGKGQGTPNTQLQLDWVSQLLGITVEKVIFIDKTIFNEWSGWCRCLGASQGSSSLLRQSLVVYYQLLRLWPATQLHHSGGRLHIVPRVKAKMSECYEYKR